TVLVEWDPFTNPILTEFTGRVEYQEILEGVTVREEFDEVTGLARKVVIEDPEGKLQPGMIIRSADAENVAGERHRYPLPVGANLAVADGVEVFAADIIARSLEKRRRPRTSPAVSRASPNCSRRASPRSRRSSPRLTAASRWAAS